MKGYKHTELGWIPEDWKITRLSSLVKLISGQHLNPDEYNNNRLGIPYFTGPSDYTNDPTELTKWTGRTVAVAKENDILITVKGSGVGSIHYLKLPEVAIGRQLMAIKDFDTPSFIYQYLLLKEYQFQQLAKGNMIPGLSRDDILTLDIKTPTVPERNKIASILSVWDKSSEVITQLIAAKQQFKKGLMQQLLTGEKRLPGFKEKWKMKTVAEIGEVKRGAGSQYITYLENSGIRLIRINDFFESNPVYVEQTKDIMRFAIGENDILFAGTGASAGASYIPHADWVGLPHSYNAPRIRVKKEENRQYLLYVLQSDYIAKQQKEMFVGAAQPFLDTSAIANFKIAYPPLNEQVAITRILSAVDKEITLLNSNLGGLKQQKQGLMQQLLTGKKRVKV